MGHRELGFEIDLHPGTVSNLEMGRTFEELVRKFNEAANEEAGDHFTPREVIRLMVDLLFDPDSDLLRKKGAVRTLFDPAAGTGGMLSEAAKSMRELNPDAKLVIFVVMNRMDRNSDQAIKFLENPDLRAFITRLIRNQVYDRIQAELKSPAGAEV